MQTSPWGVQQHGLQCRVEVPTAIEQGMPVKVNVELRSNPKTLQPGVRQLNGYLPSAFLSLSLSNLKTGKAFTIQPYDSTFDMLFFDSAKFAHPLDGSLLKRWQVQFPLATLYKAIEPGIYECRVKYSFPEKRPQSWPNDAEWKKAGFWSGTVTSGKFQIDVHKETAKSRVYLLPKRLRLEKELMRVRSGKDAKIVPVPTIRFAKEDAVEVTVPVRNGHFVATFIYMNKQKERSSLQGGSPQPDDQNSIDAWYQYKGGDKTVAYEFVLFETADRPEHGWLPSPRSGGSRVLWKKNITVSLSQQAFRKQPATAMDFSDFGITDTHLALIKGSSHLKRLDLSNTDIADADLMNLHDLKHLDLLHLYNTKISDTGLTQLKGLTKLKILTLQKTKVTAPGVAKLQKSLPTCKIEWDGAK
ncbi:MAG: hypothetical protein K0U86_01950 [Planctomycetes bacterium]|nr:hypothetical protein [Planctomycetota bacterium]MCH9723650.1 hypothetical protein [Planctomycetota bacterium]MCH9778468.1 hypothetical protein [Planctomycetota bacterium]MCH9791459.1 hypothetical protein [Planctomycetota bacterium]